MISDNPKFDVCSLSLDFPENSSALIKFDWYDSSFSITLFDGLNTWIGKMQSGTIETLSEQLGLSLQQYIRECQNAFSEEGREQGFIYLLKDDTFQWKKESSDMRILFGQIHIEKAPVIPTLHKIIDEMMNENLLLKNKLSRIEKEKMDLMSDNKHLIETLEENNKLASRMENDLYERFLKVLNTKKEKIRELKKLRSSSAKSHGGENDADISKYECETDVDSDSDEGGDGDNGSSASEKEERSRLSDKDSDSDEMSNKSLLPKRNRLITSKQSVPDELVKSQEESSLGSKKSVGLQKNKSESQRNEPTNLQPVPSTSSCFQKKVYRSVAFVDSNEELEENITIFPSDEKLIPDPKSGDNISSVMHSPKKHGRFRDQTVEDEHSVTNSESGPSAKIPKIGNKCVSDESDFSIKHSESNNLSKINQEPDVCERHRENPSDKQTKVSVKDLIDGLFS